MNTFFWFAFYAALALVGLPCKALEKEEFKVTTLNGEVLGFKGESCRNKTTFAGFRGIPYARPPLGNLRFRDPVPIDNWEEIWDATFERPGCIQTPMDDSGNVYPGKATFSEDCLYLNVYTPNLKYLKDKSSPLKAVMVFIHWGGFIMGSSSEDMSSPDFLLDQDVIVVSLNYRLGALGFLSLQNSEVPGNAGLKDQALALKWVKNNIESFGGDPNKITIFGESAGSASVSYHLLSKLSAGLFNGAIMESGTAMAPWAYSPPRLALTKAIKLGWKVGCFPVTSNQLLKCLQKLPAEVICNSQQKALTLEEIFSFRVIAFHPTTEPDVPGAFLTSPPFDLFYSGNFTKVPMIIGSVKDEGLLLYPTIKKLDPNGYLLGLIGLDLSRFAPYNLHLVPFTEAAHYVHEEISRFYFNFKRLGKETIGRALELLTDTNFVLPIQLTAGLVADTETPVYNYLFSYEGKYGLVKAASKITLPGVCHGDELGYIFYTPKFHSHCGQNNSDASSPDEFMITKMTKMWTNFAKFGNPTPDSDTELNVKWKIFTANERHYLDIGKNLVPSEGLKLGHILFWENLIRNLLEKRNMDPAYDEDVE